MYWWNIDTNIHILKLIQVEKRSDIPKQSVNIFVFRFALMEIKMMLVRLMKAYNIEKTDRTPEKLPTTRSSVQSPSEGVIIRLVKRSGAPKEE